MGYRILRDFLRQSHRDDDEGSREKGGNVLEHSIVARDWGFLATASAFVPHPGFHSGFDSIFSFFVGGWWTEEKVTLFKARDPRHTSWEREKKSTQCVFRRTFRA